VIKNLGNKQKNKFIQRRRKRDDDSPNKNKMKKRKFSSDQIHFEVVNSVNKDNMFVESSSVNSQEKISESLSNNNKSKKPDSTMIIKNIVNFNDETFESIIKEFLNINDFPTEPKDKVSLLKKFITIYKKIKSDRTKLDNFLIKISDKLNEPVDEIKVNFLFNR
jgi:hypothetical protein